MGSLAAFGARHGEDTLRRYGTRGNSFVAVVEFGERVRTLAIAAGGAMAIPRRRISTTRRNAMQKANYAR